MLSVHPYPDETTAKMKVDDIFKQVGIKNSDNHRKFIFLNAHVVIATGASAILAITMRLL